MVRLNNMQFYGYHGCLEHEQKDGNWFRVDLAYDYDMRKAARTSGQPHHRPDCQPFPCH